MKGFITGLVFAVIAIVVGLVYWLYGPKIKQDINDKLHNEQQTTEQQNSTIDTSSVVLNLTYKI